MEGMEKKMGFEVKPPVGTAWNWLSRNGWMFSAYVEKFGIERYVSPPQLHYLDSRHALVVLMDNSGITVSFGSTAIVCNDEKTREMIISKALPMQWWVVPKQSLVDIGALKMEDFG